MIAITMTKAEAHAESERLWNLPPEEKRRLFPDFKSFNAEYCKYAEMSLDEDGIEIQKKLRNLTK